MRLKSKCCSYIHPLTEELDFLSWKCLHAMLRTTILTSNQVNIQLLQNCSGLHRPYTWSDSNQRVVRPGFLHDWFSRQICNLIVILCSKLVIPEIGIIAMHKFNRPRLNKVPSIVWYVIFTKARRYLNRDMRVSKQSQGSNNSIEANIAKDS